MQTSDLMAVLLLGRVKIRRRFSDNRDIYTPSRTDHSRCKAEAALILS